MLDEKKILGAFDKIESGIVDLQSGPLSYTVRCLTKAYELLVNKYAPIVIGDRVVLVNHVDFNKASGWSGAKHFLKPGALGTAKTVSVDGDGFFRIGVIFDNESYVNFKETVVLISDENKSIYEFYEGYLKKI